MAKMDRATSTADDQHEQVSREMLLLAESEAAEEGRVRRKIDRNLIPLLFVLCRWLPCRCRRRRRYDRSPLTSLDMLAFLDRGNIGNAVIAGMSKDLDLNPKGDRYQWLLTIFYICYIVFQFSLLFWKIFPPHLVAAVVVFFW